jgi:LPXTG-motif cell wall-anchored protein
MRRIRKLTSNFLVCILCMTTFIAQIHMVSAEETEDTPTEEVVQETTPETSEVQEVQDVPQTTENLDEYYKDGKILIYNYDQLKQIGSDAFVYTKDKDGDIGTGDIVVNKGTQLTYGKDAQYLLMNEIKMDTKSIWNVKDDFTGKIEGEKVKEDETPTLYDKKTDTIYIYNPYQLMVLNQDNSDKEPVMSLDYDAPQFGMGQMIYPNGEDKDYLTYSKNHNYVISKSFSSDKPELVADQLSIDPATTDTEGRDFKGQVVKTIGDKTYILIGNEQQLRKIGSGEKVLGAVYQAKNVGVLVQKWIVDTDNGNPIMLYSGDADLKKEQNGNKDYQIGKVDKAASGLTKGRCGVDQKTGKINPELDYDKATEQTYSSNANYIIFRDIDLSGSNWTPLMFSGNMIGAKASNQSELWLNDPSVKDYSKATSISSGLERPIISNVNVNQTEEMDGSKYIGIGFFATITNEVNVNNIGVSAGTVKVSNLILNNISVQNNTNKHKNTQTVISGVTSLLGGLLGGVVDLVIGLITFGNVKLNLKDTLSALLNARATDPTIYSTGAFAGRLVGDVVVENCDVTGKVSVSNINGRTGGFVGYTEGVTQYDGLSKTLNVTVDVLSKLLNVIPGLGLGDLITILLKNGLDVGSLIPTGYKNVVIKNCNVYGLYITTAKDKDYAGGFIGQQVGTQIFNSSVQDSTYSINTNEYGGGFVGISRDADIKGTLTKIGIDLIRGMQPQSLLQDCNLVNCNITVSGTNYQGGFTGAQTNSYAVNCGVNGNIAVNGTGSYAGGFSGISTVGWVTNLGKDEITNPSLLKAVGKLIVDLLSSDPEQAGMLLSLAGISPSAILGCNLNCSSISVNAGKSYAGGILGGGDGVYIAKSSTEYLNKLSYWKYGALDAGSVSQRDNVIKGLQSVKSGENRAGGVAGSVTTANVTGLLNNTLGVGRFLGFTVHDVTVDGGYTIEASGNYAGGAIGEAVGGDVQNVTLNQLKSVTAKNRVGGFIGCAGPGDLASGNGLTLNLLGLNNLLKVENLLSVAEGVRVKINDAHVNGINEGFTVKATGSNENGEVVDYVAGGFIGKSNSCEINSSDVTNLKEVSANDTDGFAGGFVGSSQTGGLADVASETDIKGLLNVNGLLGAVTYLVPSYTMCTVSYINKGGVSADIAGGFAGNFQSGKVNNQGLGDGKYYSVYNLDHVNGQTYAGGFGGNVYSGALADSGKGISILGGITGVHIEVADLVNLINAYVPTIEYAGVKSDEGFTVTANKIKSDDTNSGSAGGFIGYGSGVQVSHCDVTNLKHTEVTPPKDLESNDGSSYFGQDSTYAVTGARYAGGYIGYMNIGSAASVGKGLKVLGTAIGLNDVLDALNVVVSTIEHSDVTGGPGGFAVKASMVNTASDASADDVLGDAGGFAGKISGGHIQNSNSYNFSYIIGQITAGGYVGDLHPGSVADALGGTSILGGLVNTKETLASLAQDFVPTIRNSSTTCIPCGGAVRADANSTTTTQRGMAGGYAGHNEGGHIWGNNNTKKWKGQDYTGPISTCKAVRIRSVYGKEIAGGFTGLMESADTASAGSLSLLWGLVKANNILGALSVVYPTEENTAVYGPLALMDLNTWNSWVEHVGKYGGYGSDLAQIGKVESQEKLNEIIGQYVYGYNVVAGRSNYQDETILSNGGAAGGYVGSMLTGTITNGQAHDTKLVKGLRCAGGFAGEMINGGAANLGGVNILDLKLDLGQKLKVLEVFVPAIKQSSVEGYQSGLNVQSTGVNDDKELLGYAGGYVGKLIGGQIWGEENSRCKVTKLRRVDGTSYVGGFVGSSKPGSVAKVDPVRGDGLLTKLLEKLLDTPTDLINVLNATVAIIRYADVESWNPWGIIINGAQSTGEANTSYAKAAGGFAGSISGTVLGKKKDGENAGVSAKGIRSVIGGEYAGGCFGIADVDAGVKVSDKNETQLLKYLLQLGRTDVLDAFRTYVYYGNVSGSEDAGLSVQAHEANKYGQNDAVTYSGVAGGFGGALLNSSVKNSTVTNLSNVVGLNSTGGFVGYSGKSGVVGADKFDVLGNNSWQLLGGALGVMDIFGSHIDDSTVTGINGGYTVQSTGVDEPIAGGFIGYANLARMSNCTAGDSSNSSLGLKQVASNEIAGGFVGKTSFAYLADVKLDSTLVDALFNIVNNLVKALYLDKIQDSDLLKINLGIIKVEALYDGNLIHVNLLGLDISVGLSKASTENNQQTDLAIIKIGDSSIKLPCDKDGIKKDDDTKSQISVSLIKANRTKITGSQVYGISSGYDVFGGGADNDKDGSGNNGISGGFVGFNNEGLLENNDMYLCDVVRGTFQKVGPFSGNSKLDSVYDFNTLDKVEGVSNNYRIYRKLDKALNEIKKNAKKLNMEFSQDVSTGWDIYTLGHMNTIKQYDELKNAQITNSSGSEKVDLNAYESDAKAVLMADTKTDLNTGESDTPEPSESQDPCDDYIKLTINKVWKDLNNFDNSRPNSITVTISRTWIDADNNKHTEPVSEYESYEIKGDANKSTWKEVIKGLPAYKTDENDKTIHYYKYSVTETKIDGYTTTIEKSKDGFTFTITNKHFPGLPDTGGNGRYLIYLIGLLLLAIYLVTGKKRNKKNQLAEKL